MPKDHDQTHRYVLGHLIIQFNASRGQTLFSDRRESPEPSKVKLSEEVTQEGTGTDVQILLPSSVLSNLPPHNCFLKIFIMHGKKLCTDETPAEVIRSNCWAHKHGGLHIYSLNRPDTQAVWLVGDPRISRNTVCVVPYSRGIKSTNKISNGFLKRTYGSGWRGGMWLLYLYLIWALYCIRMFRHFWPFFENYNQNN